MEKQTAVHQAESQDQLGLAWSRLIDCIDHDLTAPLAMLRMSASGLDRVFSSLLQGYSLAVANQLIEPISDISDGYLSLLQKEINPGVENILSSCFNFLKDLRTYRQALLAKSAELQKHNITDSIQNALATFSFTDPAQRSLFQIDSEYNFNFIMHPLFIEQLLHHLIDNALRYIEQEAKGNVKIWTEKGDDCNLLHFKDTAKGMNKFDFAVIFERFFSKRDNKLIPGLGFCRLAMLQKGGDVLCHSAESEYTHFILKFPKI